MLKDARLLTPPGYYHVVHCAHVDFPYLAQKVFSIDTKCRVTHDFLQLPVRGDVVVFIQFGNARRGVATHAKDVAFDYACFTFKFWRGIAQD